MLAKVTLYLPTVTNNNTNTAHTHGSHRTGFVGIEGQPSKDKADPPLKTKTIYRPSVTE